MDVYIFQTFIHQRLVLNERREGEQRRFDIELMTVEITVQTVTRNAVLFVLISPCLPNVPLALPPRRHRCPWSRTPLLPSCSLPRQHHPTLR